MVRLFFMPWGRTVHWYILVGLFILGFHSVMAKTREPEESEKKNPLCLLNILFPYSLVIITDQRFLKRKLNKKSRIYTFLSEGKLSTQVESAINFVPQRLYSYCNKWTLLHVLKNLKPLMKRMVVAMWRTVSNTLPKLHCGMWTSV